MENFAHVYRRMIDERPSNLRSWTFFILLWPCSLLYGAVVSLRRVFYQTGLKSAYRPSVPVISVGNLTVGGTGKTPVVDAVVKKILGSGLRVAVVSRGYGGEYRTDVGCVATGDGQLAMSAAEAGDEPCLLARRNPNLQVFVARRRALGVQAAEQAGAQVIVLDDGFQHFSVQRDLDIVLLDSRAPFGNGRLLPAGPLRESPDALQRAGLIIMTHAQTPRKVPFSKPIIHCRHRLADSLLTLDGRELPWSVLDGEKVLAFAGIARPEDFFAALRMRNVTLASKLTFADHEEYGGEELNRLVQSCQNIKFMITTEKDAVKLDAAEFPCQCLVAPLALEFDEADDLDRLLDQVVTGSTANKG